MADQSLRIAIVDDSQSVLGFLTDLVGSQIGPGSALPFQDSLAALDWFRHDSADLIIVDYVMPNLNGLQFIQAIRDMPQHADLPIIMVTTTEAREVRYQALQLGATDFLHKPVDTVEFLTRVRNLLTLSRHHQDTRNYARRLAEDVRKATQDIVDREREAILVLSRAAEFRDNETGAHLLRMSNYCHFIAQKLGMDDAEADVIFAASPMHDIGKIGIPDNILQKPGRLNDEERAVMINHPLIGWQILHNRQSRLLQVAARIAISHHEKWDGTGYPYGLAGTDIPLEGRITAVADVFDALTSRRPYKHAWPLDAALEFLKRYSGTHFDPACVDAFFQSLDRVRNIIALYGLDDSATSETAP